MMNYRSRTGRKGEQSSCFVFLMGLDFSKGETAFAVTQVLSSLHVPGLFVSCISGSTQKAFTGDSYSTRFGFNCCES